MGVWGVLGVGSTIILTGAPSTPLSSTTPGNTRSPVNPVQTNKNTKYMDMIPFGILDLTIVPPRTQDINNHLNGVNSYNIYKILKFTANFNINQRERLKQLGMSEN